MTTLTEAITRHARPDRAPRLVVARESNTGDLPLLEGMVMQTLERYRSQLAGVDRLLEIGITPVSDAEVLRRLGGHTLKHLGSKAVIFTVEDTVCLYSRGSAAKDESEKRENGFVEVLCEVIDLLRPEDIYVATFSRLVRSFRQSSPVQASIEIAGSTLHYGEGAALNFSSDRAYLEWAMMSAFAAMERDALVNRMMLGRVGKHRQGRWIHGPAAVPMGYTLDDQKHLGIDTRPGVRQAVNKAIRLMGDPRVSHRELALAMGGIGVQPPGQRRGSLWTYDPGWEWDGARYVPRALRNTTDRDHSTGPHETDEEPDAELGRASDSVDGRRVRADAARSRGAAGRFLEEGLVDDSAQPDEAAGADDRTNNGSSSTGDDPTPLSDYAVPGLFGARLAEWLDLWETGRLTLTFGNPLQKVTRYAEYLVHDNEDGPGHVQFPYAPGLPEDGWATADELTAARAVRAELINGRPSRSHTKPTQMPLLGDLGRWQEDGYWYALLSASSDRRGRYELRRLPADSARPRDNRTAHGPRFMHQSTKLGERVAIVDAHDLHQALATSLADAITTGTHVAPHPSYPPPSIAPTRSQDIAALEERHTQALERARHARNLLTDPARFSSGLFDQLAADAERAHAEAEEAGAELSAARTGDAKPYPDQFRVSPKNLAKALAVLANTTRPAPREVTRAIQSVLADLRLRPDGLTVRCEVKADIPVVGGLLRVGPVHFDVPQRLGAPNRTSQSDRDEHNRVLQSRSRLVAQRLLTSDDAIVTIADSKAFDGAAERGRALKWLTAEGMPRFGALRALSCVPLVTRSTIWHLVTGEPLPTDLDPALVDRIRETYFDPALSHSVWWQPMAHRRAVVDFLREHVDTATTLDVRLLLAELGAPASAYTSMVDQTTAYRGGRPAPRPFTVDGERAPRQCEPECKPRCYDHRRVRLLPCPHCGSIADHYVPAAEVVTSLLCGNCRREPLPDDDAPVFPPEYLALTTEQALRRRAATNPSTDKQQAKVTVPPTWRALATAWHIDKGTIDTNRSTLTNAHLHAYLTAVAEGEAHDPTAIRLWAQDAGQDVSSRGPVPDRIVTSYRRHLADEHPQIAREWARRHGYDVPRHDQLDEDILRAFGTHRSSP